jgi:hypothetical protein
MSADNELFTSRFGRRGFLTTAGAVAVSPFLGAGTATAAEEDSGR